jgi:hypothetical protein
MIGSIDGEERERERKTFFAKINCCSLFFKIQ